MIKLGRLLGAANRARLGVYLRALWKLFKQPVTPRAPRWIAIAVVAYALSPIDLIPDFIPVLGQLDDLVLVPLGIALAVKLTPEPLWQARLREAEAGRDQLPKMLWGAAGIVLLWLLVVGGLGALAWAAFAPA